MIGYGLISEVSNVKMNGRVYPGKGMQFAPSKNIFEAHVHDAEFTLATGVARGQS